MPEVFLFLHFRDEAAIVSGKATHQSQHIWILCKHFLLQVRQLISIAAIAALLPKNPHKLIQGKIGQSTATKPTPVKKRLWDTPEGKNRCDKTNKRKSLEFRQARLQTSEKENNQNSVALPRFKIPKRRHCTTGFPPYCQSSRLKPRWARNFCKQACPSLSYDRHVSIMFDWSSHSRAPFVGQRRFSKSRSLSASISFLPLPHPSFLFWLSPQLHAGKIPFRFHSLVFLCSPTPRKRLLYRLVTIATLWPAKNTFNFSFKRLYFKHGRVNFFLIEF